MPNTILHKRSATQSKVPQVADLQLGELAINTYDGKLYMKKNDGSDAIVEVGGDAYNIVDNSDATFLTVDVDEHATFSGNLLSNGNIYPDADQHSSAFYLGSHSNDPSIVFSSEDRIKFNTGAIQMYVDNVLCFHLREQSNYGALGINTSGPQCPLHVERDTDGEVARFGRDGGNSPDLRIAVDESAQTVSLDSRGTIATPMLFRVTGNEMLRIEDSGRLSVIGQTDYELLVDHDDIIPNKKYVDDEIANNGGGLTISDTAPVTPSVGDLWMDSSDGELNTYAWYDDGNTTQWVAQSKPAVATDVTNKLDKAGGTMTGNLIITDGNYLGIGEDTPTAEIDIKASGMAGINLKREDATILNNNNVSRIATCAGISGTLEEVARIDVNAAADWTLTGSPTYMRFQTTSTTSLNCEERMRIMPDGYVGIGTDDPQAELHIENDNDCRLLVKSTGTGDADAFLDLDAADTGDPEVRFKRDGVEVSAISVFPDSDVGFSFDATQANSFMRWRMSGPSEKMRLTTNGDLLVSKSALNAQVAGCELRTTGQARFTRDTGEVLSLNRIGSVTSTNNIFAVDALGSEVFRVRGDGDCENSNNRYGAISDAALKENIVDANSQWDDIKNIRVRNFNFIGKSKEQIGVVAQEVELVSPGLVGEDDDGYKNVGYSILYMKAVKALQEAMAKIETLEAGLAAAEQRITDLENA